MRGDALCPVAIEFATLAQVREDLEALAADKVVLVASRGTVERLELGASVEAVASACELVWLDASYANPTQADIAEALAVIGPGRPACIVCIGGGSAIDMGKAISAIYPHTGSDASVEQVTELIVSAAYREGLDPIEIVAVPTTAGTGSEVTKWATVWDVDGAAKYSVDDPGLYPARALICTEATLTMPPKLILATGLDALSHAMEAFWARPSDPLVKSLALSAVREIHRHLGAALANPQDLTARDGLCLGSVLAGVAFSNTRTTASHSISYPLTMRYGVDHGFAVALTLPLVAEINRASVPEIADLLGVFEPDGGFATWMRTMSADIQPLRLSAFGISEADIPELVELSFTAGRMNNNPVDISPEQVAEILRSIL